MNRSEYMAELKKSLSGIPYEEAEIAVRYYEEYFDDAGVQNEANAIDSLGPPSEVAAKIINDYVDKTPRTARKGLSAAGVVILAIFASPIALPIALSAFAVFLSLFITYGAVVLTFGITGGALVLAGVVTFFTSLSLVFTHFPTMMFFAGAAVFMSGVGLLFISLTAVLSKIGLSLLAKIAGRFLKKKRGGSK